MALILGEPRFTDLTFPSPEPKPLWWVDLDQLPDTHPAVLLNRTGDKVRPKILCVDIKQEDHLPVIGKNDDLGKTFFFFFFHS